MLPHLRRRAAETLAPLHTALLSTCGPADIQAAEVPCAARGLCLYVLLSQTSDLLFNIENHPAVVLSTAAWQVQGHACVLERSAWPRGLDIALLEQSQVGQTQWRCVVEVRPARLHIFSGPHGPETLDFDASGDICCETV